MSRMKIRDTGTSVVKVYGEVADIVDIEAQEVVDLSRLTAHTRNRVIRSIQNGHSETSSGKAKTLYTYMVRAFEIPQGHVGIWARPNGRFSVTITLSAIKDDARDLLQANLAVMLGAVPSRWQRGEAYYSLSLSAEVDQEMGKNHPREVFARAFNEAYGEKYRRNSEKAIEALKEGKRFVRKIEV